MLIDLFILIDFDWLIDWLIYWLIDLLIDFDWFWLIDYKAHLITFYFDLFLSA